MEQGTMASMGENIMIDFGAKYKEMFVFDVIFMHIFNINLIMRFSS